MCGPCDEKKRGNKIVGTPFGGVYEVLKTTPVSTIQLLKDMGALAELVERGIEQLSPEYRQEYVDAMSRLGLRL
jgi:hypothetical protein